MLERMTSARQLAATDAQMLSRDAARQLEGAASEETVLRWLAKEYGLGFTSLDDVQPDKEVVSLLPARLLR